MIELTLTGDPAEVAAATAVIRTHLNTQKHHTTAEPDGQATYRAQAGPLDTTPWPNGSAWAFVGVVLDNQVDMPLLRAFADRQGVGIDDVVRHLVARIAYDGARVSVPPLTVGPHMFSPSAASFLQEGPR